MLTSRPLSHYREKRMTHRGGGGQPPRGEQQYPSQDHGQRYSQDQRWQRQGYPQDQSWQPAYDQQPSQEQPAHRAAALRRKSWPARHKLLTGFIAFWGLCVIIGIAAAASGGNKSTPSANAPTASATAAASAPATAHKPSFPPKTLADFRAFAATGDASQVHEVRSTTGGLPSCPDPIIYVTISPAVTGRALEADLSAFFVQQGLLSSQCQPVVFAYHSMSDYLANRDNGYTAGRVCVSSTGSGSQLNLEVDAGAVTNQQAEFDFNF
jgi:hypothetical protein